MSPALAATAVRPTPARAAPAAVRAPAPPAGAQPARRAAAALRAAAAPSTRERTRAALTADPGAGPTARVERAPTTRDQLSASLRAPDRPPQPTAEVVDLSRRRAAAPVRPEREMRVQPGDEGTLAPVIPIARGRAVEPGGVATRDAAPRRTPAQERGTTALGRGPPAGGPSSPTTARSTTPPTAPAARATAVRPAAPARGAVGAGQRAPPSPDGQQAAAGPAADPQSARDTDPALLALDERADALVAATTAHTRGKAAAANAQAASEPDPVRDRGQQAATVRIEDMGVQEPGRFDAEAFKADVRKQVEAIAPPANLDEAERFEESGKAGSVAGVLQQIVARGKASSQQDIAGSTAAPLKPENHEPKPVGKLVHDAAGRPVTTIGSADVVPATRPDADVDLSSGPAGVESAMAERSLTVPQLEHANEPTFTAALEARRSAIDHAAVAPAAFRTDEAQVLPAAAATITAEETATLAGMRGARLGSLRDARRLKKDTKETDERRRDGVNRSILEIHRGTKDAVTGLLTGLDATVTQMFTDGEAEARSMFEGYVDFKMTEYKNDRYGGWGGGALWLKDAFFDLPDEVNEFYVKGREFYLMKVGRTIDSIAMVIAMTLTTAVLLIRLGRARVRFFLQTLPADLVQLGIETAGQLDQRFDLLTSDVEAAKDRMVDTVARAYVDATGKLDARIAELKEQNKGLVTRAVEFVEEVAGTIADLGRLLGRVLLKAASVITDILAHPIRFFEHLIDGVGAGIDRFASRIGRHLEEALLDLLFGHLGKTGITLPSSLDYAGLFDLVCQVLQVRWTDLRARLVNRLGLATVLRMEKLVDVFRMLRHGGVGALWELAMQRFAELPGRIIGALRKYIVEQVIKAGIGYIAALLTPASGFIKACQGIYRIVSFIVEKAKQIAEFVDSVLDSMAAIAAGDVSVVAEKIDAALAGGLRLALGFLAKLANLDAIPEKVQAVISAVRTPVRRTVDAIIDGAVDLFQRTLGRGQPQDRVAAADLPRGPPGATPAPGPGVAPGKTAPVPGLSPGQQPTKAVPAQEPADPSSITVTKDVVMDDTAHTLTFKVVAGEPQVVMGSTRAAYLQTMTAAAIVQVGTPDTKEERTLVRRLNKIEAELKDLYWKWRAYTSKSDAEKRYQVEVRLEQISTNLRMIGRENHMDDLEHLGHASRYVEGNRLVPPHDQDVRGWAYPSGYVTGTRAWRKTALDALRTHPTDKTRFKDPTDGKFYHEDDATIDHQPRVVEHWNGDRSVGVTRGQAGNNTTQAARQAFYNDTSPGKLQIVSRSNNSADGALARAAGLRYEPEVGPHFRGPLDEE